MGRPPQFDEAPEKSQTAHDRLKALAINGRLPPERRLLPEEFAEYFGFSVTPVRDALRQLTDEGFFHRGSNGKGYFVKAFRVDEQRDLYRVMLLGVLPLMRWGGDAPDRLIRTLRSSSLRSNDPSPHFIELLELVYSEMAVASDNALMRALVPNLIERTHLVRTLGMTRTTLQDAALEALEQWAQALTRRNRCEGLQIADRLVAVIEDHLPSLVAQANSMALQAQFP